jgi:predicted MFS family arabinose efflux permease
MTTTVVASSRRLTLFVSGVVMCESAFYSVVPPLVPLLVRETHMTTTQVGILVAAYPAGILIAAIPSMALVNARGVRTTAILGLGLLILATIGFAWSASPIVLDGSRLIQGMGGTISWAAALGWLTSTSPEGRRASVLSSAVGAALIGMVIGPGVGAVASALGRGAVFTAIAALLALMAVSAPASPVITGRSRNSCRALWSLLHNRRALLGNALLAVIGVANGTIASLVPLLVVRRGGSAAVIALVLGSGYVLASCWNLILGRLADRIGRQIPVIGGFVLAAILMPVLPWISVLSWLSLATVLASSTASGLWTPSAAMVTDSAAAGQSGHAVAVGTMNAAWALGGATGAFLVARIAEGLGFTVPFALVGGLCAVAAVVTFVDHRLR